MPGFVRRRAHPACEGMTRPYILFRGHEPRPAAGWTDPGRAGARSCNTATSEGLSWRVPGTPFVMETFCTGDHGIVAGCRAGMADGPSWRSACPVTTRPERGGPLPEPVHAVRILRCTRGRPYRPGDAVRPLAHQVPSASWCHPTPGRSARPGELIPYGSAPAGAAIRPLTAQDHVRGDRGWPLAPGTPGARASYLRQAPRHEPTGAPGTD